MSSTDLGLQKETKREDGTGRVATGYIQKRQGRIYRSRGYAHVLFPREILWSNKKKKQCQHVNSRHPSRRIKEWSEKFSVNKGGKREEGSVHGRSTTDNLR